LESTTSREVGLAQQSRWYLSHNLILANKSQRCPIWTST